MVIQDLKLKNNMKYYNCIIIYSNFPSISNVDVVNSDNRFEISKVNFFQFNFSFFL